MKGKMRKEDCRFTTKKPRNEEERNIQQPTFNGWESPGSEDENEDEDEDDRYGAVNQSGLTSAATLLQRSPSG